VQLAHRLAPPVFVHELVASVPPEIEERNNILIGMGWIDYHLHPERLFLNAVTQLNYSERSGYAMGLNGSCMALGLICDVIPLPRLAGWYHRRAVTTAQQSGHPLQLAAAHLGLGYHTHHCTGEWELARDYYGESASGYRAIGQIREWATPTWSLALLLRSQGEFAASLDCCAEMVQLGLETGDHQTWAWGMQGVGSSLVGMGAIEEGLAEIEKAIELFDKISDPTGREFARSDYGRARRLRQELPEALAALETSERYFARRGFRDPLRTQPVLNLAEACVLAAELAEGVERAAALRRAQQACREALKQSRIICYAAPAAHRLLGTCYWLRGDERRARASWLQSIQIAERLRARPDLARTALEMGMRTGDRSLVESARRSFEAIGARRDAAQAAAWLAAGVRTTEPAYVRT
jgi:tetratricopeptide (TPR) repeat protein